MSFAGTAVVSQFLPAAQVRAREFRYWSRVNLGGGRHVTSRHDPALSEFPCDEEIARRPENKRGAANDSASEKQKFPNSALTANLAVDCLDVDPDQVVTLSDFSSEEELGDQPRDRFDALSLFTSENELGGCPSWQPSILELPPSRTPVVTNFDQQSLSTCAGEPRSVVTPAPPARRFHVIRRLNVALATVAALAVGAIGAWQIGPEPDRIVSLSQIGRPITSNQPSATPSAQAESLETRVPRTAVGIGGTHSLEAPPVTPSFSSRPAVLERVSPSIPPALSPTPPPVGTTGRAAIARTDERRTREVPNRSQARTSDARTLAVKSPPSIGAESVIHTPEPGATDALRSSFSPSPPHGPAAAPFVEAVSPPPVNEAAAVRDVLARYRAAYEHLDARSAKKVWPSVDERALARAFDGLESQAVTFERCNVDAGDGRAIASCRGSATYVRRVGNKSLQAQSREWTFVLHKAADGWLIQAVQTR